MNYIEQEIVFRTESFYGQDVPLSLSSPLLRRLEKYSSAQRPYASRRDQRLGRCASRMGWTEHPIFAP